MFRFRVVKSACLAEWLPVAVLCGVAGVLMWRSIFGGVFLPLDILPHLHPWRFSYERAPVNNPIGSDTIQQIYPRRVVANSMLRQGSWPLWNPTILTGTPLLADGQLALFYPLSLIFLVLPLGQAFGYYALLQVMLAGLGSYLFARHLKLGRLAATITGLCYMLSGFLLTWLQFPEFSGAAAMLPWCFWCAGVACADTGWQPWVGLGAVLALPLLIQIQLAFYIYVGVGCYVLFQLTQVPSWHVRRRILVSFTGALLLASILSAVQLLPEISLSDQGQRADYGPLRASTDDYFLNMFRLVFPLAGGQPRPAPSWGPAVLQTPQPYAGLIPLLLGVIALAYSRHAATRFFGLLAVGSFALAIGTPLLQLFIMLVPPYRQFSNHARWFILWGFAVAVMAGLGLQALLDRAAPAAPRTRNRLLANRLIFGGIGLLLGAAWWRHLGLFTSRSRYGMYITMIYQHSLPILMLIAGMGALAIAGLLTPRIPRVVAGALLCMVAAVDLLYYGGSYNTTSSPALFRPTTDLTSALQASASQPATGVLYPPTRQIEFLRQQPQPFRIFGGEYAALPPNIASAFGLEDVRGYQSLYLSQYNRLARLIDGKDYSKLSQGGASFRADLTSAYKQRRLLNLLNVQFILFPPGSKAPALYAPLELVQTGDEGTIYRNPQALPRAWLVHAVEVIGDSLRQLDRLAQPDFDPAVRAILAVQTPRLAPPSDPEPTPTVRYAPNQAFVEATAYAPGLLVLADAYTPDWQVTVDGRVAPLYRTNYAFRGVWLPTGKHQITFTYQPISFRVGGYLSLTGLLGVLGCLIWKWRRPRKQPSPA